MGIANVADFFSDIGKVNLVQLTGNDDSRGRTSCAGNDFDSMVVRVQFSSSEHEADGESDQLLEVSGDKVLMISTLWEAQPWVHDLLQ